MNKKYLYDQYPKEIFKATIVKERFIFYMGQDIILLIIFVNIYTSKNFYYIKI